MASTTNKVILKILIDYNEYLKLKDCENQIKEIHSKQKKDLEIIPSKIINSSDQTGEGCSTDSAQSDNNSIPNNILSQISNQITQEINEKFEFHLQTFLKTLNNKLTDGNQVGAGSEDILPPIVEQIPTNIQPFPTAENIVIKSNPHDSYDKQKLLKTIPNKFHKKASLLLDKIDLNSMDISFNSSGEVFIDSQNIPNSNIFDIFPALYIKKKTY